MVSHTPIPRRKRRVASIEGILILLTVSVIIFFSQFSGSRESDASVELSAVRHDGNHPQGRDDGSGEKLNIPKTGHSVRFVHFNVCNYFVNEDPKRTSFDRKEKSEESCNAVADVLAEAKADVIGMCEIGGKHALSDLRKRLEERGLHYPHGFVLERDGEDRALAVLSKHPITENESRKHVSVPEGNGKSMLRGMLDVTVKLPDERKFRMVGIHLKSKRDMAGTADMVRRREAYSVRLALNHILKAQQGMPLLVFGDFNDGPSEPAVQIILGNRKGTDGLTRLKPADTRGERWTHFYGGGEEYLSYDHILVNRTLKTRLGRNYSSGIIDIPQAKAAADHRAVWVDLK